MIIRVQLNATLTAEACGQLYEALTCLAKFGDTVLVEVREEKFTLMTVNLSKTGHAKFIFDAESFFVNYKFGKQVFKKKNETISKKEAERFTAQIYNKALQCAFKGRTGDPRGREMPIESCQISLDERPEKTECRLIIKMHYKHGMTKCYKLNYEPTIIMHALYPKKDTTQSWRIASRVMREYIEFFGAKTEQLALVAQEGKAIFTSFTEKVSDDKQVLKQPVETCITLHVEEFEDFHVKEKTNIVVSVKDFKALVTHADTLRGPINAQWIGAGLPMLLEYQGPGMNCDFTLMTTGDDMMSTQDNGFISMRSTAQQSFSEPQPFSTAETSMQQEDAMLPGDPLFDDEASEEDDNDYASPLGDEYDRDEEIVPMPSQDQLQVPSSEVPQASPAESGAKRPSEPAVKSIEDSFSFSQAEEGRQPKSVKDSFSLDADDEPTVVESFSHVQTRRQPSRATTRSVVNSYSHSQARRHPSFYSHGSIEDSQESFSLSQADRPPSMPMSKSMEESFAMSQTKKLSFDGAPSAAASQGAPDPGDSLFMPADDDEGWDEMNYDSSDNDEAAAVYYNPVYHKEDPTPHATFRDTASQVERRNTDSALLANREGSQSQKDPLGPTQRLSALRGMFD